MSDTKDIRNELGTILFAMNALGAVVPLLSKHSCSRDSFVASCSGLLIHAAFHPDLSFVKLQKRLAEL